MLHLSMVGVTRLLIGRGKRNSERMELIQKVVGVKITDVNNCERQIMLEAIREVIWIIVTNLNR